jgi:5-methylthioadenosine/S-adenosylhomocysteine deaminase
MDTTLVRNCLVCSAQAPPFDGWVSIRDSWIAEVGSNRAPQSENFEHVVDAQGAPLIPGLINSHAHSQSTLTRGSAEGLPLDKWLPIIFREMRSLTREQAYCAALVTYAEALLSGTTCILDMCQFPDACADAAQQIGIRAILAPYVGCKLGLGPTLDETDAMITAGTEKDGLVQIWVGLAGIETSSDLEIEHAAKIAQRCDVGFHTHCSETKLDNERTRRRTGRTPVAHLDTLGAIGPKTLLAHCVWLADEDREILQARGAHIAHCPQSNLKLGSGIAPIDDYRSRSINVVLGTDGAKANNRLDLFDTMKFASLVPKGLTRNSATLPPSHIFEMATSNGAKALGLPCGVIEPKKKADLVLLKPDLLHIQPVLPETILPNLVHAARGGDVAMVWVDGKVVVENGRLLALDQSQLAENARAMAKAMLRL